MKVVAREIRKGMFIAELDRPWMESPFLLQGFMLETDEDIRQVRDCCEYVLIDPSRSDLGDQQDAANNIPTSEVEIVRSKVLTSRSSSAECAMDGAGTEILSKNNKTSDRGDGEVEHVKLETVGQQSRDPDEARSPREVHDLLELPGKFVEYKETSPVEKEINTAKEIHIELETSITASLEQFKVNRALEIDTIKESTSALVDSMIRNPDASYLLAQLKQKDSYTYIHSVDASILAILFGRHLGLTAGELNTLALSVLLIDIGKMKLPGALLEKKEKLVPAEVNLLKKHVQFSMEMLRNTSGIDHEVLQIIENHHERFDGKGYPAGKPGNEIPVFAKIASIIDFYDAVTHDRPYRRALRPCHAINALYERRGTQFQKELVEEFIQCLGVYPTGSLVQLSSGEVGIVVTQNHNQRLRPRVLIVRDELKKEVVTPFTRNLANELMDNSGNRLFIRSALRPGAFGITPEDFYL